MYDDLKSCFVFNSVALLEIQNLMWRNCWNCGVPIIFLLWNICLLLNIFSYEICFYCQFFSHLMNEMNILLNNFSMTDLLALYLEQKYIELHVNIISNSCTIKSSLKVTWSRLTRVNSRTQLAALDIWSVIEVLPAGYTPIWLMIVSNTPYSNTILYQYCSSSLKQSNYLWIWILPPPL